VRYDAVRRVRPWAVRTRAVDAAWFVAPFLMVLVVWTVVVRAFHVPLRLFPSVGEVFRAGLQEIQRGTLFEHIAHSLTRVAVGTILASVFSALSTCAGAIFM
jgi:taurine transport system permease protein